MTSRKPIKSDKAFSTLEKDIKFVRGILTRKGGKALKEAQNAFRNSQLNSKELASALNSVITHWNDLTRPALIALSCEAVSGKSPFKDNIAAAMVLLGAGVDIHDDIIDQSETKFQKKTLFGAYGSDISLLTGDLLITTSLLDFASSISQIDDSKRIKEALKTLKLHLLELVDGELLELRLRRRTDITPEEYLKAMRLKAAEVEAYTRIGGIIGNGTREEINALGTYGRNLGLLIELRDDLADMLNYQGELSHRIKKETLPLPMIYALQAKEARDEMLRILNKHKLDYRDGERLFGLCQEI